MKTGCMMSPWLSNVDVHPKRLFPKAPYFQRRTKKAIKHQASSWLIQHALASFVRRQLMEEKKGVKSTSKAEIFGFDFNLGQPKIYAGKAWKSTKWQNHLCGSIVYATF